MISPISVQTESSHREIDAPTSDVDQPSRGPSLVVRASVLVGVIVLYMVYRHLRVGVGRDVFQRGLPVEPFRHALTVLKVEHALWLDFEWGVQNIFTSHGILIRFVNGYYSWSHQIISLGLVAFVLLKAPWRSATRWVGALMLQLPIGLALFSLYPLMPPRLLDAGAPWGGRLLEVHRNIRPTGIIDTLVKMRGWYSPDPVSLHGFTNQYAAMPSLHCAFALWVGIVWWKAFKGRRWRAVGPAHTAFMFFCVVVTGNHFVLDAVAGWALCLATLAITCRSGGWVRRLRNRSQSAFAANERERNDHDYGTNDFGTNDSGTNDSSYGVQGTSNRMPSTTSASQ